MSTRAIVTSQPDVACYVCGRRLLRGEHPELFLIDGQHETVCELCAPRAAHQGWTRGDEERAVAEPVLSNRRGGGLLGRLREATRPAARRPLAAGADARKERAARGLAAGAALAAGDPAASAGPPAKDSAAAPAQPGPHELALDAFNCSEYPRRIASLARSLGVPEVSVMVDDGLRVATIVVAWELCWYRYRVDLDEQPPQAQMIAEGRTLDELERDERLGNALADAQGGLSLAAAAV